MAYLGPPPSQKLATPTSQYFSGNGSTTAFTLNRPVNVAEDLNVFVNNVAQQPGAGKSYTATGTTLTFDAAPDAGTNNVYVVYRGLAEPTTRLEHPSGQPISATTGTFSGDLTVDTTTLKVDSTNNRVGVGVAAPDAKLHVLDTAASTTTHAYTKLHLEDSDHLAMQFSGGTSGEQWIWFSDDTTATPVGGITYYHGGPYMGFRVEGTERMRINSSGNLLVGTATPNDTERLTVLTTTDVAISTRPSSASNFYSLLIRNASNGNTIGSIYSTTTSTSFNTSSDYRLKENVTYDWNATSRLKQLKPARFNFIAEPDITVDGFLAHEAATICPESVTGTHNEVDDDGNAVMQGIDQSKLTPLLTKALIETVEKIEALEARIAGLESK